jgi:hypothetical protein
MDHKAGTMFRRLARRRSTGLRQPGERTDNIHIIHIDIFTLPSGDRP